MLWCSKTKEVILAVKEQETTKCRALPNPLRAARARRRPALGRNEPVVSTGAPGETPSVRTGAEGTTDKTQVAMDSRAGRAKLPNWARFLGYRISVALHYAAAFEISMALRVPKFDQAELDAAAARRMAGGG